MRYIIHDTPGCFTLVIFFLLCMSRCVILTFHHRVMGMSWIVAFPGPTNWLLRYVESQWQ